MLKNLFHMKFKKLYKFSTAALFLFFVVAFSYCGDSPFRFTTAKGSHWEEKPTTNNLASDSPDFTKINTLFVSLANKLTPSVVNIYTKAKIKLSKSPGVSSSQEDEFFRFFFGHPFRHNFPMPLEQETSSLGSGFVLNKKGIIITNSHVIRPHGRKADEIMIKFKDQKGRGFPAEIVGFDESTDVAVLKLKKNPDNLVPVFLGSSDDIQVGEWVLAIGNPYGHANTVTQGIVSALSRHLEGIGSRADFIQTSASINPGNSGGPLFNLKGEVVGINTAIDARAQGIGFSIPISPAKAIIEQLIENGSVIRGWIGVGVANLTPNLKDTLGVPVDQGVVVQTIEKGEPAERAGLRVYDVIVKIDGKPTSNVHELSNLIAGARPGKKIELNIYRNGKKKVINVRVARRPLDQQITQNVYEKEFEESENIENLGLALNDLSPIIRKKYRIDSSVQGVLVSDVARFSIAYQLGFGRGDVITEVNRKPVVKASEITKYVKNTAKFKGKLLFRVLKANGWSALIVFDSKML